MTRYLTEAAARADGYTIEHRADEHRFVVVHDGKVVGYAKYTVSGDNSINFDSTLMSPSHRGTGISALLVTRALADDIVKDRNVRASCWYVAEHIERHPGALAEGATYVG